MCGIFGMITSPASGIDRRQWDHSIRTLFKLSQPRGQEAAGLSIAANSQIFTFKRAVKPSRMLKNREFSKFLNHIPSYSNSDTFRFPIAAIGHTRMVTNGTQVLEENNQPIVSARLIGVHNGIITNDSELCDKYLRSNRQSATDSSVLFHLIDNFYSDTADLPKALSLTYSKISGAASIAMLSTDFPRLTLATNTGSLYYAYSREEGLFAFGSEHYIVERFLRGRGLTIYHLKPFHGAMIYFESLKPDLFSLRQPPKPSKISVHAPSKLAAVIEKQATPKSLRRCLRCVLPDTYPFIEFNAEGICNYCREYKKQLFFGRESLEKILAKYRSKDGSPDCIMGFSGGRDSTYGLHVIKEEFGMTPIAYTYDWGMVTDQARRNQSRVVGELGVEHIIRSADIHKKRSYIRKNIYAWLKKPHLGMVPLFMAGDKMFYYYGRKLRKETGLKLTLFAAGHQLEQMEFKAGFCGVNQRLRNNTKLYHFGFSNKVRLASYYIKQYLTNPSYMNASFMDSIFSFYASFINRDDYLYLYYYIPWDEKIIEKTVEKYGWEPDLRYGKNQWRMGDGHTAFVDYIYHEIAGFSEFDNFRSNQIREGFITRQEALELIERDNQPKMEILREFSQLVGFNLEEVLLKINAIPKLYS